MADFHDAWQALSDPWRLTFSQAWAAYQERCCPVGAVVLDPDGAVVAQARNRVRCDYTRSRDLADTKIAHAGINALAQIPTVTQHTPWQIYSTIEPCMMCIGAIVTLRIPSLFFGSTEFYAGATQTFTYASKGEIPSIADLMPEIVGPLDGNPISDLFLDLYIAFHSWLSPSGPITRAYEVHRPSLYERARQTAAALEPYRNPRGMPLQEALASAVSLTSL